MIDVTTDIDASNAPAPEDSGAAALAFLLQLLQLPADAVRMRHELGALGPLDETDLLRAARRFPVKARLVRSNWERLERMPLPALARLKDGGWLVVGRVGDGKVLIQDPL